MYKIIIITVVLIFLIYILRRLLREKIKSIMFSGLEKQYTDFLNSEYLVLAIRFVGSGNQTFYIKKQADEIFGFILFPSTNPAMVDFCLKQLKKRKVIYEKQVINKRDSYIVDLTNDTKYTLKICRILFVDIPNMVEIKRYNPKLVIKLTKK